MRRRTRLIASAVITALAVLGASAVTTAGAQNGILQSDYPPFDTSSGPGGTSGNWTGHTTKLGLTCLLSPLTCPDPKYDSPNSGGAGGGGAWLRIKFPGLIPAAADVFTSWSSSPFTYDGAEGKQPTELTLSLFRQLRNRDLVDPDLGNQVLLTVAIVDTATHDVVAEPIDNRPLHEANGWTRVEGSINPDDLALHHSYSIVIVTELKTGAKVLPSSSNFIGIDNVDLNAKFVPGGGGGGGGGGKTVFKHWNRLIVADKCPKALHAHSCLIHLVTYKSDFSGVHPTPHKTVRRRGHHLRKITLRVRPEFNDWARQLVRSGGRLHVHETVKAHHRQLTRNRTIKTVAFKKP